MIMSHKMVKIFNVMAYIGVLVELCNMVLLLQVSRYPVCDLTPTSKILGPGLIKLDVFDIFYFLI